MTRITRALDQKVWAAVAVAACALLLGGCPDGIFPGLGGGVITELTVVVSQSGEPTVGKVIDLQSSISAGTEPYAVQWTLIDGPDVDIEDATSQDASFLPTAAGFYTFALNVSDARTPTARRGYAEVEIAVGNIQFIVQNEAFAVVGGNPAVLKTNSRSESVYGYTEVSVFDPEFPDLSSFVLADQPVDPRQTTEMTVTYEIVSVPAGARMQDTTFDRSFDTIENDWNNFSLFTIQANPEAPFDVLTNIGTLVENFGTLVPGDYVFRATVTNPNGLQRTRDLTVTLSVEGVSGSWGSSSDGAAVSAGPAALKVKELPQGSPGRVTDKVMTADQSAALTVTVLPSTDTVYRFYLEDDNGVAHPELVTASADAVVADGAPHDITLTIASTDGLPIGTHTLKYETFDSYGAFAGGQTVSVNNPAVPVRFHVTADFLTATQINAALVGAASNDVDAPTQYEGWTGDPDPTSNTPTYGKFSALADANLDGAPDLFSIQTDVGANRYYVRINVGGFKDGSVAALRHPQNNGNFGPSLPAATFKIDTGVAVAVDKIPLETLFGFAVGDLNGDDLADFAIGWTEGAVGQVTVFFHTGDPIQPYSDHADQTLLISPPQTSRLSFDSATNTLAGSNLAAVDKSKFGFQIGIFDQTGDGEPDLIVTDPKFSKAQVLLQSLPTAPDIAPPAANDFYLGQEGRVYVFAGGASGELKPGRPALFTSLITEREITDGSAPVFPTNPVLSTSFAEANVKYTLAYEGAQLDLIGHALSNGGDGFAVGSAEAAANGAPMAAIQIFNPVSDGEWVDITVTQPDFGGGAAAVARRYEFDTDAAVASTYGVENATVDVTGDTSATNAIAKLIAAINAEAAGQKLVTAAQDGAYPERVNLIYAYGAVDAAPRTITAATSMAGAGNAVAGAFAQNHDGRVYRVASNQASGALTTPIDGIQDSNMGLGEVLALGNFNAATTADDLAITALDAGTANGANNGHPIGIGDDGAVFVLLDGSNTLGAPVGGVGAATLASSGPGGIDLTPTAVGARLGFGDVSGDGLQDLFFTEPGFDRIFLIKGAATPATTPDITFWGVTFSDQSTQPLGQPDGGSLAPTGTFLFGDINGDTETDWLFLDTEINVGFAGFER